MGKYELQQFYEDREITPPLELTEGDSTWTSVMRMSSKGHLHCVNPTNHGKDYIRVLPSEYPDTIDGVNVISGSGGLNKRLTRTVIYLEVTDRSSGDYKGRIPKSSDWPQLEDEIEDFYDTTRESSVEWGGTPQEAGSTGADQRTDVLSEEDVRGSKNDLIK